MKTYYFADITMSMCETSERHIIEPLGDGGYRCFPATEDNPNMVEYLAWLAEGNEPEEWKPEETE